MNCQQDMVNVLFLDLLEIIIFVISLEMTLE